MMNKMKRILALVMAMMMFTTSMPVSALADTVGSDTTGGTKVGGTWLHGTQTVEVVAGKSVDYLVNFQDDRSFNDYAKDNYGQVIAEIDFVRSDEEGFSTGSGSAFPGTLTITGVKVGEGYFNHSVYSDTSGWTWGAKITVNVIEAPAVTHTVTFVDGDNSENTESITAPEGTYTLPKCGLEVPSGKEFKAWLYNGTEYAVGSTIELTGVITLVAVWQDAPAEVQVTFNANGGNGDDITKIGNAGRVVEAPTSFSRDGYKLVGWSSEPAADLDEKADVFSYNKGSYTIPAEAAEPVTAYAVWQKETPATLLVGGETIYMKKGETRRFTCTIGSNSPDVVTGWNSYNFSYQYINNIDKVYTFELTAKEINTNGLDLPLSSGGNTKFYIVDALYNVSFDANGGSGPMADVVVFSTTYTLPACTFTAPDEEHEFAGWARTADGEVINEATIELTGNTTLYATWKAKPAKVSVTCVDGENTVQSFEDTRVGDVIDLPTDLTRDDYKFLGWSEENVGDQEAFADIAALNLHTSKYTVPEAEGGQKTLYAVWQELPAEVTVKYDLNNGTGEVAPIVTRAGETIEQLPTNVTREDYVFIGWTDKAENPVDSLTGDGVPTYYNSNYVVPQNAAEEITLYALWGNTVKAAFMNGTEQVGTSEAVMKGGKIVLPSGDGLSDPENRENYVFYGWTTEQDGTVLSAGTEVELGDNTTYYAIWDEAKLNIDVTVKYLYKDTTNNTYVEYESEKITIKAPSTAYTVTAKDYDDNVLRLNDKVATVEATFVDGKSATCESGKVVFNTNDVAVDETGNGSMVVNFYYDAYYTLDYRAILPYYTDTYQYEPGQTGSFQYGDEALDVVDGALYVVPNVEGLKFNELSGYKNASEVLYARGYYNGAGEPQDYKYSEYNSEELLPFSLQTQPKPGATIYYYYRLKGVGDSNWPGMEKLTFAAYYLNMFNSEMNDAGLWENMTDNIGVEYIFFGETMTFNFPFYWANAYEAGNSSLSTIGYYKDSPFVLWKYGMDKNQQYEQPENHTVAMINASSYFFSKGIPEVYIGGVNTIENMRVPLLYNNEKSLFLSVEYYLDGVQIGETEWYRSGEHAQSVSVKPLPVYEGLTFNEFDWTVKCFDPLTGDAKTTSVVYGDLYDGSGDRDVYGNGGLIKNYKMPDRHIKYYITTNAKTTSATVEKVWNDNENKAGMRPSILEVKLNNGGTYVLSVKNEWKLTVDGLRKDTSSMPTRFTWNKDENKWDPVIDENVTEGTEIKYSWSEKVPEVYTLTNFNTVRNEDGTFTTTLTNTYNSEYVSVSVEKVWDDMNNAEEIRPESVKVQLVINGVPSAAEDHVVELSDVNDWSHIWSDLDAKLDGKAVVYDVVELTAVPGYTATKSGSAASGFTITNKLDEILVDVTVKKVWDDTNDQDGLRPDSLKVTLSNGAEVTLNEENKWTATIKDLPKYANNELVQYTWTEEMVDGYALTSNNTVDYITTLTNTHTVEKIDVSVEKKWEDAGDQDGKRPANITVQLKAGDENVGAPVTLPHEGKWSYTWTDLDKKVNGTAINYTVVETNVPEAYEPESTEAVDADGNISYTITNSYTPETKSVTVTKVWDDDSNRDGVRPEKITLQLKNGDTVVASAEVEVPKNANSFTHTFEKVPVNDGGREITYTVDELDVADYEKTLNGLTVTNKHTPATTDVPVVKKWDDQDNAAGFRPSSVTIELHANGTKVEDATFTGTGNEWSYTFKDLPVKTNGTAITYTAKEPNVPQHYTATESGLTVTNKHTPETTEATVVKVWTDEDNQDGIRPPSLTVKLLANDVETDKTVTLNEGNNWTAKLTDLPKYANGQEIKYTWSEGTVSGYTLTGNSKSGTVTTLTNTHTPATITVSVNKVWVDENNQDGKQPDRVTVRLLANGVEKDSVVLNAGNSWKYDFENLPKFAGTTTAISYTVTEDKVEGYTTTISGATEKQGDVKGWDYTITNTHAPEVTSATVKKEWNDSNNQDGIRPESLMVTLSNGTTTVETVTLNEANGWTATVENLPKYAGGQKISYTWSEPSVEHYTPGDTTKVNTENGTKTTITNNYTPGETSVTVTKIWDDANNQDGIRPTSVEVQLYADGTAEGAAVVLNKDNNWSHTWQTLPLKADGQGIAYTVDEPEVPAGYTKAITGNASEGYTITNSHDPATTEVTVTKVWSDNSDQDGIRPEFVKLQLYADGKAHGQSFDLTGEGDSWSRTITGLPKHAGTTADIVWTVKEVETPEGYEKSESGLTVTNTHTPETITIAGEKFWADNNNQDGKRPGTITVNLMDGETKVTSKTVSVGEDGKWVYSFTDLPKYRAGEVGALINYTITEDTVPGYTSVVDGYNITNTHEIEKVRISGTKEWRDANDRDGKRPESITINLLKNDEAFKTATATEESQWAWSFTDLNKYEGGEEITYTIKEVKVEGYTTTGGELNWNTAKTEATVELVNTHEAETTDVTATKVWKDNNNQDGKRADVTVTLYKETETIAKTKVDEKNIKLGETSVTWEDLPVYEGGKKITYSVEETQVDGYKQPVVTSNGDYNFTITNELNPETVVVRVTKKWVDGSNRDGIRPDSVTVQLMANDVAQGAPVTLSETNNWHHEWPGLPKNSAGTEIAYTVVETEELSDYTAEGDGTIAGGFVITNTHNPDTTTVTATKEWDDADNQDGKRTAVTLTLYKTEGDVETKLEDRHIAADATGDALTVKWEGLYVNEDGAKITYTVKEDSVPAGYEVSYSGNAKDGFVVKNSHTPETIIISGEKVWDDANNQDGLRPSVVTINIMLGDKVAKSTQATEASDWAWSVELPKYANGVELDYTVDEVAVPEGYVSDITVNEETGFITIKNTHVPYTTSISGIKAWEDNEDQDGIRPASVTIKLYADGVEKDTTTATAAGDWTWSFDELPLNKRVDGLTSTINYTVEEVVPTGYTSTLSKNAETGFITITNTHTPEETEVAVKKVWADNDNQDGARPTSIVMQLKKNGENYQTATLTAPETGDKNTWSYTFENLPMYDHSTTPIEWTVDEVEVPEDYIKTGPVVENGVIVITNTHTPETIDIIGTKTWIDADNQDGIRPGSITVRLYADETEVDSATVNASSLWGYSFEDLPKYRDQGTLIAYTIAEDKVDGYEATYNNYNITNTHTPEKISVSVKKVWDDAEDQDGKRPESLTVKLLANNVDTDKSVTLPVNGKWEATLTGLDKFAGGQEIAYTWQEDTTALPEGYSLTGNVTADGLTTLTNTYEPGTTNLNVTKVWEDGDNRDATRPASITVQLLADGQPGETAVLNASNNWNHNFTGLAEYADGELVTYTVAEVTVPTGYTSVLTADGKNVTIINTYNPEITTVSGSKTWNDDSDRDKVRPESITINLLADGTKIASKTVTANDEWTWEWKDLPKNKNVEGVKTPIDYTITEDVVPGYTTEIAEGSYDVTNTHVTEKTSVTVTKVWKDKDDQDGIRPGSVTINLLAGGVATGDSVVLNAGNKWTATFADLNKNDQGEEIEYTIEEVEVVGYECVITGSAAAGYTVTNTYTPETITIAGEKFWDDNNNQDGKRPGSITVKLLADGKNAGTATVTPNNEGKWQYSFTDLPKYRDQGTLIVYTIDEITVPGYETTINEYNITNKHEIEKVSIFGTKVWDDADDQDGARPDSITINLKVGNNVLQTKEVSEVEGKWTFSFTNLDKYKGGSLIAYTIEEVRVSGYDAPVVSMTWDEAHTEANVTVTNAHDTEETSVTVTKTWEDGEDQDGLRPDSITVQLYADGVALTDKVATFGAGQDGTWTYTFTELPKFAGGQEIKYTITEDAVTGYTTKIDGFAITNTHQPEETEVNVTKTWDDANDQDGLRPTSITVQLYADGNALEGKVATITAESADADGNWTHSFTGLPKYRNVNGDGVEIIYTITETPVTNYTTKINGFAITNSHTPATVKVEGTKTWDDADDQDGLRPASITVQLLADGEVKDTKTVTAKDGWTYSFTDLPANKIENGKGGKAIVYTVKEVMDPATAEAYTSTVTDYNIKNTHTPEVVTVEGAKTWDDANNQDGKRPTSITIKLLADGEVKDTKTVTAADGWAWKWENLPKFEAGEEITYSITEEKVTNYNAPIYDGYNVTNTHDIEKVTVAGRKIWNDFDNLAGIRPEEITINLLADGEPLDSKTVTEDDGWAWTWENLDKYAAGKEIAYTITENAVDNYSTEVQSYNVENSYTPGKTSVSVTKAWDDDNDRDGLQPDAITVQLLADGEAYATAELNADNGWSYIFRNLPIYKEGAEGVAVVYTVAEAQVPGYELPVITGSATEGYTITNTHHIATTKVEGTKVWDDANNQDGVRKESVTIRLLANGTPVEGKVAVVDAASEWKFSFDNLPVNANGEAIVYTVSEDKVDGYTTAITGTADDGFTVTNTHTPEETEVSVTKAWEDADNQDGLRPSKITIKLAANGQAVASKEVTATEGWSWKFTQLPKYDGGEEIVYTVSEDKVDGYTTAITGTAATGYTITNTHTPGVTSVSGTKTWADADNQDGKRPASITVNLLADGEVKETKTVTAEDGWKYSFTDLPTHADGAEIDYSVEEVLGKDLVDVYTSTVDGYDITNTHTVEKTEVKVTKAWDDADNQDNKRAESVTINLLADGEATDKSVELSDTNNWTYTFENLDKYSEGVEIEYTVEEAEVPEGYEVAVTGDAATGYTVTNTHDIDTTKVEGAKTWMDNNDQDGKRPESITVRLLADGTEIDSATVTADNGWKWSFTNLPVNKEDAVGQAIEYTITEDAVPGYTTVVDGYNITNTHEIEKVSISGTKEWNDADDQDGLRPDFITINLLKNEKAFKTTTATEETEWAWSFTNLDKYENGEEIAYSIEEIAVEGYETTGETLVWNEAETEATVALVNTHTPAITEIKVTKTWNDADDQDGKRPTSIKVQLLAGGVQVDEATIVADQTTGKWEHTFPDLPVKAAGEEITYTITETAVPGYETSIDGFDITNTHEIIKTSVTGTKIWDDADNQDGKRPTSINVNLLADGTEIKNVDVAADVNGDWIFSFTDLPAYANGKLITYTVTEDEVEEYSTKIEGYTITNSYTPGETSISGEKFWDDANNQDGLRPESITVNLVALGKVMKSVVVTAEDDWKYSFEHLPTHVAGREIAYTIEEVLPEELEGIYISEVNGNNITNTHVPYTTSISGEKTWNDADNQDGIRPGSITVNLLANGEKVKSVTVEANAQGKWLYTFENLPVNENGKAITYTVTEEPVEGYQVTTDGYDLTNTHIPATTSISGEKTWDDENNQDGLRPESITVNLLVVKGENDYERVAYMTVTEADDWAYTFENLPVYAAGEEIVYKVTETAVANYTTEYDGNNIINTHETEKTSISGQKTWDDLDNFDKIRPASIVVKVMNGNDVVATQTVTEEDGWQYTFTGLEKNAGGQAIQYTIVEEPVEGYTATVDGYDITNKTDVPQIEITKVAEVKENLKVNDVVNYTITVTNVGNVDLVNVKVTDEKVNLSETIDLLIVGASKEFPAQHIITEEDLIAGEYVNTARAEATSPDGEPTEDEATETVETIEAVAGIEVTKVADEQKDNWKLGETVTYTITVTNTGNVTLRDVAVNDAKTNFSTTIPVLAVDDVKTFNTEHTITEEDLLAGEYENTATATATDPTDPTGDPVEDSDTETVITEEVDPALKVTKSADVTKDVKVGDTITYTITVENTGNVTLKNITVEDDLTGDTWTIDELGVGKTSKELTATYIVKESDLLNHKIENIATATTTNPDDPTEEVTDQDDETVETEEVDPGLKVTKTADVTKDVKVGDTITYTITVENTGNVTLKNITVEDDLTGDTWTIDELGVGKTSKELTATYVVSSDDILDGIIKNIATAETTNPDDPDEPVTGQDDEIVEPEPVDTTLEVIKESEYEGETVGLGEVISYTITVTNKGNVPFTNVEVIDEMTGDEWLIETLGVGETKEFETTYTVTSDDILKGEVLNVVTAEGDPIPDPDPDVPPHIPEDEDEEDDPTDPIDTTLTVVKTSDKQGQKVKLGETIKYTITVTNDGNVPYTNVEVVDELTGDKWTIEVLPVGATETFTAEYTVTAADIQAGTVLNSVTAKGDEIPDPDPDNPPHIPEDDDEVEDDPEDIDTTLTVVKTSDVTTTAQVGDTITYTIVVKNDGNVDYTNVKVDDELTGLHETIAVLKVGESQTFTTTRVVTAADAAAGHILNVAVAKADPIPDPDDPDQPKVPEGSDDEDDPVDPVPVVPEIYRVTVRYWYEYVGGETAAKTFTQQYATGDPYAITSPKVPGYTADILRVTGVMEKQDMVYDVIYTANEYTLTVEYIYLDGSEAAPTYTETLKAGDEYHVVSPVIDGYRASMKVVEGTMPARDVKYTVVYVKNGNGYIIIDDYDTPLGIGNVHLNAGECFE